MFRPSRGDGLQGRRIRHDPLVWFGPSAVGRNTPHTAPSATGTGSRVLRRLTATLALARGVARPQWESLLRRLRRYPLLLSAPFAAAAVGAGFGAQTLLQPVQPQRDLLEALIAQPGMVEHSAAVPPPTHRSAESPSLPSALRAERAAQNGHGFALAEPGTGPTVPLEIRVALFKLSNRPVLSASGPWRLFDRDGQVLASGAGGDSVLYSPWLDQHSELWLETLPGQQLIADGRPYEGRLRLLRANGGLQVVNHLPLENYISSVVGGEMPSFWNPEALRAQAVAARSYALAHMARPASSHWHLGDTPRWQNYEGLSSVTGSTRRATASTSGIILSYQGGIVESLYAATQQIVDEAHSHLGASMSQNGAQQLASRGLRYNEILGQYYRGASLARLQSGAR